MFAIALEDLMERNKGVIVYQGGRYILTKTAERGGPYNDKRYFFTSHKAIKIGDKPFAVKENGGLYKGFNLTWLLDKPDERRVEFPEKWGEPGNAIAHAAVFIKGFVGEIPDPDSLSLGKEEDAENIKPGYVKSGSYIDGVKIMVSGMDNLTEAEVREYCKTAKQNLPNGNILTTLTISKAPENNKVALDFVSKPPKFDRIRRITGYLVGSIDRWNNAKRAEERDRVKHSVER